MRAHSAIFPLDLVSRQGKYLYTVHRVYEADTTPGNTPDDSWLRFVQGIPYYPGKASRVYQISLAPEKRILST